MKTSSLLVQTHPTKQEAALGLRAPAPPFRPELHGGGAVRMGTEQSAECTRISSAPEKLEKRPNSHRTPSLWGFH